MSANGSLIVNVASCTNVPNIERSGTVDPYVQLTFQGIKKKTNHKSKELNPVWNEKLEFDLKGNPLLASDVLDVEIKDYEAIGLNRLLAKGQVQLSQLVSAGTLKSQLDLTDADNNKLESSKLLLNLEYNSPTSASSGPKPAPVGGGAVAEGEGEESAEFDRFNKREAKVRSTKVQDFQIRVKILQGRQLEGTNLHPMCRIKCAGEQKHTKTFRSTANPYWNEIFYFNVNEAPSELFDKMIEFEVYNASNFLLDALIGSFKMDIGFVHDEPKHSLISKWLLLSDPEDLMAGARGYLKVSINVLGPGDEIPPTPEPSLEDDVETNLLKPAGMMLRPATFVMKLYRADDLPRRFKKHILFFCSHREKELVDPYVIFGFAGKKVQSKIAYSNANPIWNQLLKIGLKFPSMCDKISITIKDWDRTGEDDISSVSYLPISLISSFQEEGGFLPTFGPCYVNAYGGPREFSEIPTVLDELNQGKGEGVAYRGRVLFELSTIMGELPKESIGDIKPSDVTKIEPYLHRKRYKLHAAFLGATMISQIDKPIEFEVSIGNYGNKLDENQPPCSSTTAPCNPLFDGCAYYFLPWGDIKPCIQISSEWEDISYRIDTINQISKFKKYVESCINTIRTQLDLLGDDIDVASPEMSRLAITILKMIENIKERASAKLPEPIVGRHCPNDLDKILLKTKTNCMNQIVAKCEKLPNMEFKAVVEELEDFSNVLNQIEKEPQNSIPDVIIWMLSGNERTAYFRIPANEIMFSPDPLHKGELCSVLQTLVLKWPGKLAEDKGKTERLPGIVRVKLWLGFEKDEKDWLNTHMNENLDGAISMYAETYENQAFGLLNRKWSSEGLSRPMFSDLHGKMSLPKDSFKLPTGWDWEGDWDIAPELSSLFEKDAGFTNYMEQVYEQQYRTVAGGVWEPAHADKVPYNWAGYKGEKQTPRDQVVLAENWKWDEEDWMADISRAVDNEGWEYCVEPAMGGWSPTEKKFHLIRRRRWIRNRSIIEKQENTNQNRKKELKNSDSEGWEYAKMFTTKFHSKTESTDSVRRRRWHRPMKPVNEESDMNVVFRIEDPKGVILNAPRLFLKYQNVNKYQLRAYIYQARSLPAADTDTSLSDPYCQVAFITQSMKTEVIKKCLSPTWDQTLIFTTVEIFGNPEEIMNSPPQVMVEVFDYDEAFFSIGGDGAAEPDFLGRCAVTPVIKTPANIAKRTKLEWYQLKNGKENAGEILACFELFPLDKKNKKNLPALPPKVGNIYRIPNGIRPELQRTMIEILCWGVRNMKTFQLSDVDSPQCIFECGGQKIESEVLKNLKRNPNFKKPVLYFDLMIPKEEIYIPPMNINVLDHRMFGRKPIVGVHGIKSLSKFRVNREKKDFVIAKADSLKKPNETIIIIPEQKSIMDKNTKKDSKKSKGSLTSRGSRRESKFKRISKALGTVLDVEIVEDDIDWWCKYYVSIGEIKKGGSYFQKGYDKLVFYLEELEKEKKFEGFLDFCQTFPLVRGKSVADEEDRSVGEFKGMFKVYPISEDTKKADENMIFGSIQPMVKEECTLRIYVIKGINLQAKDSNGKSDPYIQIECGKTKVCTRDTYIPNTINPEFGRMFELKVILPIQKDLCIRVIDYDFIGGDDLIGETWIDLENRFLTKYRAICGLPLTYCETGINKWRDAKKPSQILEDICKLRELKLTLPQPDDLTLVIDDMIFTLDKYEKSEIDNPHLGAAEERLCLHVLHEFGLVPEHIETRKLYNPIQPEMEQGRIEMWVDMFPKSMGGPGPAVDISPRKPKKHVLRCVVWNTSEVPCVDDDILTGEKMSDIYITGWLGGLEDDKQSTDIHYRSMDGDGNFNWRFTFDFDYLPAEQNMVVRKKEHFWSLDETETKLPPILVIQIWDNDKFSADDFISAMSLDLNRMLKPEKEASKCGLHQIPESGKEETSTDMYVSLFDQKRLKGWWPCIVENGDEQRELAGKIELEIEILTEQEALERPAGRARDEPNDNPHLDPPNRPATSFLSFTNPFKSFKNMIWNRYKWTLLTGFLFCLLILFFGLFLYAMPGAIVNKIVGV